MINIDELDTQTLLSALVAVIVVMGSAILYLFRLERTSEPLDPVPEGEEEKNEEEEAKPTGNGKKKQKDEGRGKKESAYTHPWLMTTLKGHTATITGMDFAQDGKKFISVSADRTVFMWRVSDFQAKEHRSSRQILDFDTASKAAFAPDCKSLIFSMKRDNKLAVFKWTKKDDTGAVRLAKVDSVDFPICHQMDINHLGISATGKFLMSASNDCKVTLYDIRGEILKKLDPKVSTLYDASVSPDGRFISICGFTPDVLIYEPVFKPDFKDCQKVFDLKGQNSGVFAAAFNQNSTRAVTVSKDGYWRVFDTEIRYAQGQEAALLRKGEWAALKGAPAENVRLAISPSGGSVAIAVGGTIKMCSAEDETKEFGEMADVHSAPVQEMRFSPCGTWLATCGDKYIRLFNNVPELHSTVVRLQRNLPEVSAEAARRRMMEQIEEARQKFDTFAT